MPSKFCYFTGTNRAADVAMAVSMLRSARAVGVEEDFHLFAPIAADGIEHHAFSGAWRNHLAKVSFLRQLASSPYDYCVWIDTDTYFVRHPGDLSNLIRDNKCFVSMEGEITSPNVRQKDWWSFRWDRSPSIIDTFRRYGCGETIWSTNGGMWIVRTAAITEFADRVEAIWRELVAMDKRVADEPPLAIVGQTMVPDPQNNTVEIQRVTWACDWVGRFNNRLPNGQPWRYQDWLTGKEMEINPAIVHAMRSKDAMRKQPNQGENVPASKAEPVGTKLSELLAEIGVSKPACQACQAWIDKMDEWGIDGCKTNRRQILHRLAEASDTASWLDMAKVVANGYLSTGALLDEAIKRAAA